MRSLMSHLPKKTGTRPATTNRELVQQSDVVVLAVTPNVAKTVLKEVRDDLNAKPHALVSIVAGLALTEMEEIAGYDLPILRTLPNLNVAILEGMTAVHANENLVGDQKQQLISLFEAVGSTTDLPRPTLQHFQHWRGHLQHTSISSLTV